MTDIAYQNAMAERDEIARKINEHLHTVEELKRELARADQFLADWERYAGVASDTGSKASPATKSRSAPKQVVKLKANPPKEEVGNVAAEIINEVDRPLPRAELFNELQKRGINLKGKDPEMVLSTMMWRMQDRFVRLPLYGYWVKDRPYEKARYTPGTDTVRSEEEDKAIDGLEQLL